MSVIDHIDLTSLRQEKREANLFTMSIEDFVDRHFGGERFPSGQALLSFAKGKRLGTLHDLYRWINKNGTSSAVGHYGLRPLWFALRDAGFSTKTRREFIVPTRENTGS